MLARNLKTTSGEASLGSCSRQFAFLTDISYLNVPDGAQNALYIIVGLVMLGPCFAFAYSWGKRFGPASCLA